MAKSICWTAPSFLNVRYQLEKLSDIAAGSPNRNSTRSCKVLSLSIESSLFETFSQLLPEVSLRCLG